MEEEKFQQLLLNQNEIIKWVKSERAVRQEYFSIEETATITGLDDKTIRRVIKRGELVASDIRKEGAKRATYCISRKDIDAWMESKRIRKPPAKSSRRALVKQLYPDA